MDFFKIIDDLSKVDADVLGRFDSRRAVFGSLGNIAKRSALAATPLFLGALFQKAYAGTTSTPVEVLQYALTLELFEQDFYAKVKASSQYAGASAADKAAIDQIKGHEDAHVALLRTAITGLGGTPVASAPFKSAVFAGLTTFAAQLGIAQLLEDTGVRAYKGRAGELLGTDLLTVALQIHSVEARHASKIRYMRGQKPWVNPGDDLAAHPVYTSGVTGPTSTTSPFGYGIPAYTAASPVESNTTQSNVPITTGLGATYTAADAAASFDEYLQAAEVLDASRAGGLVGA
ncbi:ferritin-like domain-containing protein [Hymenobacter negativus]|uniref:Ferritin-like domain-containing protein n=1 Tax=Hymenobacter negativus TaxID=2795026 RepID=A0ABS3QH12_9BACT|nr:ferritin-like domain-containing protein [Hymenobacter negativus]MBO2010535.1 ferritin-like domain-containing protein [Hymenobacter negativus]